MIPPPDSLELPPFSCPVCHYVMNHVVTLGNPVYPKPGDLSVCVNCLSIGVFLEDGQIRPADTKECEHVPEDLRAYLAIMMGTRRPS